MPAEDGGVVDQVVDATERARRWPRPWPGPSPGSATSTRTDRGRPSRRRGWPSATVGGLVLGDVGHHHRGPGRGQRLGVGLADARRRNR